MNETVLFISIFQAAGRPLRAGGEQALHRYGDAVKPLEMVPPPRVGSSLDSLAAVTMAMNLQAAPS